MIRVRPYSTSSHKPAAVDVVGEMVQSLTHVEPLPSRVAPGAAPNDCVVACSDSQLLQDVCAERHRRNSFMLSESGTVIEFDAEEDIDSSPYYEPRPPAFLMHYRSLTSVVKEPSRHHAWGCTT